MPSRAAPLSLKETETTATQAMLPCEAAVVSSHKGNDIIIHPKEEVVLGRVAKIIL